MLQIKLWYVIAAILRKKVLTNWRVTKESVINGNRFCEEVFEGEGFEHWTSTFSPIGILTSIGVTIRSSLGNSGLLLLTSHPLILESLHLGHFSI